MKVRWLFPLAAPFLLILLLVLWMPVASAPRAAAIFAAQGVALAAPGEVEAPKEPTTYTVQANAELLDELPFEDRQDYEDAQRGLVATLPDLAVTNEDGHTVWSLAGYDFLNQEEAPASVNPSLWRMAQLNLNNGLFQVTDRIYQVPGFDLSNLTIVEGDTGVILIDPSPSSRQRAPGLISITRSAAKNLSWPSSTPTAT